MEVWRNLYSDIKEKLYQSKEIRRKRRQLSTVVSLAQPNYGRLVTMKILVASPSKEYCIEELKSLAELIKADKKIDCNNIVTFFCRDDSSARILRKNFHK